tara:strand:- start:796 stop:1515 length:720 start_codon:yes stop_codon:yes gene_type:complete
MKRRHRNRHRASFPLQAIILFLSLFILLTPSAEARSAGNDMMAMKPIVEPADPAIRRPVLPLTRPEVTPAVYPGRGLHFDDPLDVTKARMTSGYGWRMHPVLKVRKLHKGVDYAAPKGTPVFATEDGIIGAARWHGNYGKLVTVKHSPSVETYYAHLSGFAPGIRTGVGVRKGDVIGYVGRTGLATGNHLYYEVAVDDERIDPLADDLNEQVNVLSAAVARPGTARVAQTGMGGLDDAR